MKAISSNVLLFLLLNFFAWGAPDVEKGANHPEAGGDVVVSPAFLQACTEGNVDRVQQFLQDHPDWILHGRSEEGETCLHVAGIYGQPGVTRLMLEAGADPDVRSTFARGLRMTPLSWNVYAGHVETARVLLEVGEADVNLDFDAMGPPDAPTQPVTCYDIVLEILQTYAREGEQSGDERQQAFLEMKALLEKHGAKTYESLQKKSSGTEEPEL